MLRTPHNWRKNHFNREASFNNLTPESKAYVESQPKRFAGKKYIKVVKYLNSTGWRKKKYTRLI